MKTILLTLAAVLLTVSAQAKTYDCTASGTGKVTVDSLTISTTVGAAYVYPVGVGLDAVAGQSTMTKAAGNVDELGLPVALQDSKGGTLMTPSTSNDTLFARGFKRTHELMYGYLSWGLTNEKNSGYAVFMFKQTDGDDSSNLGQWSREYACVAR